METSAAQVTAAGFFLESEYKKHNNTVRVLVKNTVNNTYLSLDQAGVRIWESEAGNLCCEDVRRINFPKAERGFISCVIFVPSLRLYFGACLDMTIQVFDVDFKFLQAVPTGQRSVLCLDYDSDTKEVISAGIDGVKIWRFRKSRLLRFRKKTNPPNPPSDYCLQERKHIAEFNKTFAAVGSDAVARPVLNRTQSTMQASPQILRTNSTRTLDADGHALTPRSAAAAKAGRQSRRPKPPPLSPDTVPRGVEDERESKVHFKEAILHVEALNLTENVADEMYLMAEKAEFMSPKPESTDESPGFKSPKRMAGTVQKQVQAQEGEPEKGSLSWVFEVCRFDRFLFVVTGDAVVALDVATGGWLDTWRSMHEQIVTCVLFYPPRSYLLTASNDCTIKVWTVNSNLTPSVGIAYRQPSDETISLVHTFNCFRDAVKQIALHPEPDRELLLACSHDCTVRVFHLGTMAEVFRLDLSDPVSGICPITPPVTESR